MTPAQFDRIPDHLLRGRSRGGCTDLIDFLDDRGWRMTLLELEDERYRRGIRTGTRRRSSRYIPEGHAA